MCTVCAWVQPGSTAAHRAAQQAGNDQPASQTPHPKRAHHAAHLECSSWWAPASTAATELAMAAMEGRAQARWYP